jgi:hypothetical protein
VGDGEYDLCLRIGELITLQETLNLGPQALCNRFANQEWMVGDITETIRLALIGGGLPHQDAFKLVKNYVKEGHLFLYVHVAHNCLLASLMGVDDEPAEVADDGNPLEASLEMTEESNGAFYTNSAEWQAIDPET